MDWTTISGFSSNLSLDLVIIGALALLATFEVLRAGAGRIYALALALPATLLVYSALLRAALVSDAATRLSASVHAALIGAVFVALYFLIRRMTESFGGGYGPLEAIIAGAAFAAIVVSVWLQVPELQSIWQFGPHVAGVFSEAYRFWWLAGAYAALGYVGR